MFVFGFLCLSPLLAYALRLPPVIKPVTGAISLFTSGAAHAIAEASVDAAPNMTFEPRGITTEDTVVFVIGCVPFVWAGVEFWRRIAVGDPFGTGSDSVIINDSSGNRPTPLRRVLGTGALVLIAGVDVLGIQ